MPYPPHASPSGRERGRAPLVYPRGNTLYLNVTNRCTLACIFCPKVRDRNYTIDEYDLKLREDPSADDVWTAVQAAGTRDWEEVVFTGFGEPTHRLAVVLDLIRRLKGAHVRRVRLDTDGLANLRENRDVCPDLASAGLDAVSVSLNAQDADTYARNCVSTFGKEAYAAVRAFLGAARRTLPVVTATAVGVPSVDEAQCRGIAAALGVRFRWRPYTPSFALGDPARDTSPPREDARQNAHHDLPT